MKKKLALTLLAVTSTLALSGCDFSGDIYSLVTKTTSTTTTTSTGGGTTSTTGSSTGVTTTFTPDLTSTGVQDSHISTYAEGDESGVGYTKKDISAYRVANYPTLSALQKDALPSVGVQKILVVPVCFSNTTMSQAQVDTIAKAYNGEPSDTGWQSLRSFYRNSSYGRLTINSTIAPSYTSTYSTSSFASYAKSKGENGAEAATNMLASSILSTLSSQYNLADYDNNNDGYIDGLEMVYNAGSLVWDGTSGSDTEVWWNYTAFDSLSTSASGKKVGLYFWSRIQQMQNGYYSTNIDAHTLIHETGHMLGLDDYYSYDDDEGPAGLCDMMDMNIGDHNAFSKMLLGWVKPMILDSTASNLSITLNSFTQTGDAILLRNTTTDSWNGTPYDEYLILQYYTPTYLNQSDAAGYKEWKGYGTGGLYKKPGLQVFHVDARMAYLNTWNTAKYTDSLSTSDDNYIIASNTGSSSVNLASSISAKSWVYNSPNRLLKAVTASGSNSIYSGTNYEQNLGYQNTLFGTSAYGESYSSYTNSRLSSLFPNGTKFNDGSTLNWSFNVASQTATTITLNFTKTA
jgi:M6 family metalloprotease-like protein